MQVAAGCTAANYTWPAPVTKQANNFNGPPGNDLNFRAAASDMRTVVTGGCKLRFVTHPANARSGQSITGIAYNPGGPAVSVEVVDGADQRVTGSSAVDHDGDRHERRRRHAERHEDRLGEQRPRVVLDAQHQQSGQRLHARRVEPRLDLRDLGHVRHRASTPSRAWRTSTARPASS